MVMFCVLFCMGGLMAEGMGYAWHRWVSHLGILKSLHKDLLRRRHYDHHMYKYGVKRLSTKSYEKSCEVTFYPLAVGIVSLLFAVWYMDLVSTVSVFSILVGATAYGVGVIDLMHKIYHVHDEVLQNTKMFRREWVWKVFCWLKDYHQMHHYVNKNYGIVLPIFDLLFASYESPKAIQSYKAGNRKAENLFPDFDPSVTNTCGEPLF